MLADSQKLLTGSIVRLIGCKRYRGNTDWYPYSLTRFDRSVNFRLMTDACLSQMTGIADETIPGCEEVDSCTGG